MILFLVAGLNDLADVDISLVGDDGFGIVIHFGLYGLDVVFDVLQYALIDIQGGKHLVITLKDLDGVPALLLLRHIMHGRLLDMRQCVLHAAGEGVLRNGLAVLGGINGSLGGSHHAGPLQRGDLHHLAAQLAGKLFYIDLIAVLLHDVHHIDGDDDRDAKLGQLGGQVQVTLQVGTINDVQDGIGALAQQIITGYYFFQGVGGKGINAGQVGDGNTLVLFQLTFLFLYGNTRPVAYKLVGAGQRVEQGSFTAVGVTGKGNSYIHALWPLFLMILISRR